MPLVKKTKIALLIAGAYPGLNQRELSSWIKSLPEINIIAHVEPILVFNDPSVAINSNQWVAIYEAIKKNYKQYEGFIVLHDMDNIIYTASALSFLCLKFSKPIVVTTTEENQHQTKLESRANLINATQAISAQLDEVCLMFGNKLIRGNQATFEQILTANKLDVNERAILGRVDFSIRVFDPVRAKKSKENFISAMDEAVLVNRLGPNPERNFNEALISQSHAVLINAKNFQKLPPIIYTLAQQYSNVPFIVWQLEKALEHDLKNIACINNLSWPTMQSKLSWALKQNENVTAIIALMRANVAGELF